jgi:hypothetical protein
VIKNQKWKKIKIEIKNKTGFFDEPLFSISLSLTHSIARISLSFFAYLSKLNNKK